VNDPLHIVGAGPVGSLLALMLARRGFAVAMHERRPDPRKETLSAGRSINLAVSTRGLHALKQVGLEQQVLAASVPMRGRMMHAVNGDTRFHAYGAEGEFIHSMSRGGLNALLLDAAEGAHESGGGKVSIEFRSKLVDFASNDEELLATFRDERGEDRVISTPTMFGTDGSASAMRAAFKEKLGIGCSEDLLDFGYKELTLPAARKTSLGADGRFLLEPHALHIWPRGSFMMIALPNQDGSFTCTVFLPFKSTATAPGFDRLTSDSEVDALFAQHFPDARALIPDLLAQFSAAPLGQMLTVRTERFNHGGALLLGDAAHAIVPFFGQGMNAGFEDCSFFGKDLNDDEPSTQPPATDWPALFAAFSAGRKPHTDAIAQLALENFIEMRDRVADPQFLLARAVEAELQKRIPEYRTRYQLVTFSVLPYAFAQEAGEIQQQILARACSGKSALGAVDLDAAEREMRARLVPRMHAWKHFGSC
jgi:kynurenine 3-monooxygenase